MLIAPAGHGKTTLLKRMTLKINQYAAANPLSNPCVAVYFHVNTFLTIFNQHQRKLSNDCILQLAVESLRLSSDHWDRAWCGALQRLLKTAPLVVVPCYNLS